MVSPNDEERQEIDAPEAQAAAPAQPPRGAPRPAAAKRKRSLFGSLILALLLLVLVSSAAGYAVIAFKDKDERLKLAADYLEPYVAEAEGNFWRLKEDVDSMLGAAKPPAPSKVTTHRSVPAEAPGAAPPAPAPDAGTQAPPPSVQATPEPAPEAPPLSAEIAPATEPPPMPSQPAAEPEKISSALASALESRIGAVEESAQKALRAAEAAQAIAEAAAKARQDGANQDGARPAESGALTAKEQLSALEGRIDELGEEVKALRERLDSPKSETRAAPEATAARTPDGSAAIVVLAYALQRELDAGRPYADEVAALSRLGADASALAILTPMSEKGAPTATRLKAEFAPVAKRIRALEAAHSTGEIGERIMQGASKLVRVRPSGQAASPQTLDEKVAKIEAALTHDDLAAAEAAFSALPEAAQGEAKDFGEDLRRRVEAARAANDLLHDAIAALGGVKN